MKIIIAAALVMLPVAAIAQGGAQMGNSMGSDASAQPNSAMGDKTSRAAGTPMARSGKSHKSMHHATKHHGKMHSTSHAGSMSKGGNTSAPDTGMMSGNSMTPQ